jgi:hypothetical protein
VPKNMNCSDIPIADVIKARCPNGQSLCEGGLQCADGSGLSFFRVKLFANFLSISAW